MVQTLIQSAAEGYASCDVNADGELDADCEAETFRHMLNVWNSLTEFKLPKASDFVGGVAVILTTVPGMPAIGPALEAGAIIAEKLENGEDILTT